MLIKSISPTANGVHLRDTLEPMSGSKFHSFNVGDTVPGFLTARILALLHHQSFTISQHLICFFFEKEIKNTLLSVFLNHCNKIINFVMHILPQFFKKT